MKITEKDLIGDLTGFPIEVAQLMLEYQKAEDGVYNIKRLQRKILSAFIWSNTPEKGLFWSEVIGKRKFDVFFEKYPKKSNKLTEADLIGELKDFPIEVVEKMLEKQVEQGQKRDVTVFQRNRLALTGGFDWSLTSEREKFWTDIIIRKNFDLFFVRYPKFESIQNECKEDPKTCLAPSSSWLEEVGSKVWEHDIVRGDGLWVQLDYNPYSSMKSRKKLLLL